MASLGAFSASPALAQPGGRPLVGSTGGSDYIVFGLDGCDRSAYAVVPGYLTHRALIDAQLRAMYAGGQRRVRISVPVSATGSPPLDGLAALMETFRRVGFAEVLVVVGGGKPPPASWRVWDEAAYRRRLAQITRVRAVLAGSGMPYRIDLLNEGLPTSGQPILLHYTQRLWADYGNAFGHADTLGFSMITDPRQDRFAQLHAVYGDALPTVFDLHFYQDAGANLVNAHHRLAALGYGAIPWIIGESFYDDAAEARDLSQAMKTTGQHIAFLLQWPLTSAKRCDAIDVPVPSAFQAYRAAGF